MTLLKVFADKFVARDPDGEEDDDETTEEIDDEKEEAEKPSSPATETAAATMAKDKANGKAQEMDLASAEPKQADKQEFVETKNVEEVFGGSAAAETGTSTKEDIKMADDAAEVAEKAQEVPEESVAAENAAEVSKSAEVVHANDAKEQVEEKNSAKVADEVSKEAQRADVGGNKEADEVMAKDEEDRQGAAGTADEVAHTAQVVHANDDQSKEDELTSMMSKTQISETPSSPKAITKHPR